MASLIIENKGQKRGNLVLENQVNPLYLLNGQTEEDPFVLDDHPGSDYKAVLTFIDNNWLLIQPKPCPEMLVNHHALVGIHKLDDADVISIGAFILTFKGDKTYLVDDSDPEVKDSRKCPICLNEFCSGDKIIRCPECSLSHHETCWLKKCGSYPFCGYYIEEE